MDYTNSIQKDFFYLHLLSEQLVKIIFHDPQKSLYQLSGRIAKAHEKLKRDFPDLRKDDTRITVYSHCVNTVESVLFSMIFEKEQLADKSWYQKVPYIEPPTDSQISSIRENYDAFLSVALVTEYFACFEIFFRNLIKKLIPTNKENSFHSICEKILKKLSLQNYQHKFDMYRFIRNSLHNNGIVTEKDARPILYNGVWYKFEQGKRIQVNWRMLCKLSAELEECLSKIIYSKKVSIFEFIKDPSHS